MRKYRQDNDQTQHTLHELRQSLDSMEKMIQKSYNILNQTKLKNNKQVQSDSIQLRLKSKEKKSNCIKEKVKNLQPLNNINISSNQLSPSKKLKTPQKTKPFFQKLRINTQEINEGQKQEILICDGLSPIYKDSALKKCYFDSSFASSLDQGYFQRLKTEGFIDSRQTSFLNDSLEKKTFEGSQESQKPKKIVLKRRKDRKINNLKQLQAQHEKIQKNKMFGNFKRGKYSYNKAETSKIQPVIKNKEQIQHYKTNTISSSGEKCKKHQKENQKMNLNDFIKKVKNYGFIERYLNHEQICSIYSYLKKSSIPQYKWPLFVVDQVYEKMRNSKVN